MFPDRFSQRDEPLPDILRYEIPELVRGRILATLQYFMENVYDVNYAKMLTWVAKLIPMACGGFSKRPSSWSVGPASPGQIAEEHFMACTDARAIDCLEFCFKAPAYNGGQPCIDSINAIFRETGIGYEFSELVTSDDPENQRYPRAIKKSNELIHSMTIVPCLHLLSSPIFSAANDEMLLAHKHYREGNYKDANTSCGRAFETTLKTICEKKGWTYDKDKDTLATLIKICKDKDLFPGFYAPAFEASGTIRNKLGGHGPSPTPLYGVDGENVEHMIQTTSAHILLLVRLAGL